MVPKKNKAAGKFLGGHQRAWVWGRHLVTEIIRSGKWPVHELVLADDLAAAESGPAAARAAAAGIAITTAPGPRLTELVQAHDHQGYAARMGPFPYAAPADLAAPRADGVPLVIAVLDGIQDDHNLGAIIRSAEVLGVHGILIGGKGQAGVTSLAARSSAGAVCRLPVSRAEDLAGGVTALRATGIMVAGASEKADRSVTGCDLRGPVAVVLGNEGRGLSPEVAALCTAMVRIPQAGQINSLNVAAAAAVLFYEIMRQRS
ncbi:MAG: RNA methyltransferase [Planctomycetota bacterium]